jgi:hypothetical protein
MAIIDISTGIIRGKLGAIVFEYRMGTNYARKYSPKKPPPTERQAAHRKLYAQLQGLGSIWLGDLIKPYFLGDQKEQCAYRQFIKYNWPIWDKAVPAWTTALPFWGYGTPPTLTVDAVSIAGYITADLFPPPPFSVSGVSPRFLQIRRDNLNWVDVPDYTTLTDRHRAILPDADGYNNGEWNLLCWYTAVAGDQPVTDPVRG